MSILIFFIILSILVLVHELGHFIVAKKNDVYVEEFGFGLPPRLLSVRFGETRYSLNALPFGGFVKVLGEEAAELQKRELTPEMRKRTFVSKTPLVRATIIVAGVVANFLLGWLIISYLFTQGVPVPTDKVIVEVVSPDSPAKKAGLQIGDVLVSLSRQPKGYLHPIKKTQDVVDLTKKYAGQQVALVIKRDQQERQVLLTPRSNPPPSEGALGINIGQGFVKKQYPWYSAPFFGLVESLKITQFMVSEIVKILIRWVTFQKVTVDVAGPLGIARITSQAVKVGYEAVLQLLGILSFNLAIINIFPFPALDGGRLAFILYEWIFRKKINAKIERRLNLVGFALLFSLIIVITINDIVKIVGK